MRLILVIRLIFLLSSAVEVHGKPAKAAGPQKPAETPKTPQVVADSSTAKVPGPNAGSNVAGTAAPPTQPTPKTTKAPTTTTTTTVTPTAPATTTTTTETTTLATTPAPTTTTTTTTTETTTVATTPAPTTTTTPTTTTEETTKAPETTTTTETTTVTTTEDPTTISITTTVTPTEIDTTVATTEPPIVVTTEKTTTLGEETEPSPEPSPEPSTETTVETTEQTTLTEPGIVVDEVTTSAEPVPNATAAPLKSQRTTTKKSSEAESGGIPSWVWILIPILLLIIGAAVFGAIYHLKIKNKKEVKKGKGSQSSENSQGRSKSKKPTPRKKPKKTIQKIKQVQAEPIDPKEYKFNGPLKVSAGVHGPLKHGVDGEKSSSIKAGVEFDANLNEINHIGTDVEILEASVQQSMSRKGANGSKIAPAIPRVGFSQPPPPHNPDPNPEPFPSSSGTAVKSTST